MRNLKIGSIGAQGHMGKAFGNRFREIQKQGLLEGWELHESTGHDNVKLARTVDLLALMVRPDRVVEALAGVQGATREGAGLLSFAGAVPLDFLQSRFNGEVGRAMADLNFEQAMRCGGDERMKTLMDALSEDECLETADEFAVDQHTTLVACNPGISAWHFLKNEARAEAWLRAHNELTHEMLGVSRDAMQRLQARVLREGNFAAKIKEVATKGGVTEAMVNALEAAQGDVTICDLFQVGMDKIAEADEKFQGH
ncbi:MAG: hypothetical protein WC777_01955 [Candidatus Gracilibacteria bacterium]|jgi:pyrroline-5-carboxylate reductase